eukprot:CAMPEP_0174259146 /NCGR_PEP_ID=MMETSP0439-20130205/8013_1 /TAXON_ID=0 /ORGANISM="Stereomyxa ramosa, Strain Chinc5" /LENGTH=557 /DNA_ID=CAMNT_0015342931 /DNA_START=77 /DNA_END=1750 /DNA_ORIENTATION=-
MEKPRKRRRLTTRQTTVDMLQKQAEELIALQSNLPEEMWNLLLFQRIIQDLQTNTRRLHAINSFAKLHKTFPAFPPTLGCFQVLPLEIQFHILSFLPPRSLGCALQACATWHALGDDLWRLFCRKDFGLETKPEVLCEKPWSWFYQCKAIRDPVDGVGFWTDGVDRKEGQLVGGKLHGCGTYYVKWSGSDVEVPCLNYFKRHDEQSPPEPFVYNLKETSGELVFGVKFYEGEWRDDKQDGKGVSYYPHGTKLYEGDWKGGKYHGTGTYFYGDGTKRYEGEWDEQQHGWGTSYYPSGVKVFVGHFECGLPHGQGVQFFENGQKCYEGEFVENKAEGLGVSFSQDGNKLYEGEWFDNKHGGLGVAYYSDGAVLYVGEWWKGNQDGFGALFFKNGNKSFVGKNKPHNVSYRLSSLLFEFNANDLSVMEAKYQKGVQFYEESGTKRYEGEMKERKACGRGVRYRVDGTKLYEGQWLEERRHGHGVAYHPDGVSVEYAGGWKVDRKCGWGIMYFCAGGVAYEGAWRDGLRHGLGISFLENGSPEFVGSWSFGQKGDSHLEEM